jgi:NhaA family Na+:H+ antiporter
VRGWGVPMATDIAFALGVLSLLGDRVSLGLKVFLLALAIVDDLGAVLVIALFYSENISIGALLLSFLAWAGGLAYGRFGGGKALAFALIGLVMWYFMLKSGVHATIAGVLMALAVPLRHQLSPQQLQQELRPLTTRGGDFEQTEAIMEHIEEVLERAQSPLHKIEHALAPFTAFVIMPVFAFFNAGLALGGSETELISAVSIGAFVGLLLGKPIGVAGFVALAVKTGLTRLPEGASWQGLIGVGLLAGIGFTMSLFIASLAFPDPAMLGQAKIGVLCASVIAALAGLAFLHRALPRAPIR